MLYSLVNSVIWSICYEETDGRAWTGLIWLRDKWKHWWTFGFHKVSGNMWIAEELLACQGLCSFELVMQLWRYELSLVEGPVAVCEHVEKALASPKKVFLYQSTTVNCSKNVLCLGNTWSDSHGLFQFPLTCKKLLLSVCFDFRDTTSFISVICWWSGSPVVAEYQTVLWGICCPSFSFETPSGGAPSSRENKLMFDSDCQWPSITKNYCESCN